MNALNDPLVIATLNALHKQATDNQRTRMAAAQELTDPEERKKFHDQSSATAFMAVGPEEGNFLNFLVKKSEAKSIVEFGCSFGISTIYLAAAAKDNGGTVTTTEMEPAKWSPALKNIGDAGLSDIVTLLRGDALKTLSEVTGKIDFLFLDGAKHLYLAVFELLRPQLGQGAIIFADNTDKAETQPFVNYILGNSEEFTAFPMFDNRVLVTYIN